MSKTMVLKLIELTSRFGFNSGAQPQFVTEFRKHHPEWIGISWTAVLKRLVREHLLPHAPGLVVNEVISTGNPLRTPSRDYAITSGIAVTVDLGHIERAFTEEARLKAAKADLADGASQALPMLHLEPMTSADLPAGDDWTIFPVRQSPGRRIQGHVERRDQPAGDSLERLIADLESKGTASSACSIKLAAENLRSLLRENDRLRGKVMRLQGNGGEV